jgi:hypothetical protein
MTLWKQGASAVPVLAWLRIIFGIRRHRHRRRAADRPTAVDREREIERLHAKIGQDDRRKDGNGPR